MLYLSQIRYVDYKDNDDNTQYLVSVSFTYEDRPDPFSGYKSGFEVRIVKRCTKIQTYTHPSDFGDPAVITDILTKTYHIIYLDARVSAGELSEDVLPLNGVSFLSQVKIEGHDGATSEFMPPLEFSYTGFDPAKRDFYPITGKDLPGFSFANPDYELADMFGNGLPDIIQMNGIMRYWRNLGNGKYDLPKEMKDAPSGIGLRDPGVQMMDADGDGRINLFVNSVNGLSGYFSLKNEGLWDKKSFKKYKQAPSFSLQDPEVKLLDLDGDGVTDVLRNGSRLECFFNDPDVGFYKTVTVEKKQIKGFPNISFADPRVRIADMTGDGMQDIVLVSDGNVEYWPNMGHGKWGAKVSMVHGPRYPYQYDPKRILIGDIDGDGMSDIVYVDNNKITLWMNQSGNQWSDPILIEGTPPVFDMNSVRIADMQGTGIGGIVWSYDYDGTGRERIFFHDFTGGIKPYLLHEMNNHMGAITRTEYLPSTHFYLKDQEKSLSPFEPADMKSFYERPDNIPYGKDKRLRTPWKTTLPFPVQVVSKVEVIDEISGGKLTTEYSYHHGYWDGGEREFRGFGRVIQRDTETFERFNNSTLISPLQGSQRAEDLFNKVENIHYSPPTETRTWFHLGPVGDEFGDWNEVDFRDEYWEGDEQVLTRPASMLNMISALPRRARRDAYRTLRGSILRTELYALDGSARQNRPYTVSENLQGVRLEYTPENVALQDTLRGQKAGSGYIFFSHGLSSRSTQWERGEEPMTQFSFTEDYDVYGIPHKQIGIAVPRGVNYLSGNAVPYLCTFSDSTFVNKDNVTHYLIGRATGARSYEVINNNSRTLFALKEAIMANPPSSGGTPAGTGGYTDYNLLSHSVTFYDGTAFTGLSFGVLGDYGVPVKTETLMMTDANLSDIYGMSPPPYILHSGSPSWPGEYPIGFQSALPVNAGYVFHAGDSTYEEGYYCIADRKKFDFHNDPTTAKGMVLQMKDPLENVATVAYDGYKFLPVSVTDPAGMETLAEYDYRVLQASQVTDPNLNRAQFAFSPLGFLFKSAVMGKSTETKGDTLAVPGSLMEYDFFAFVNSGEPVFVKTTKREHHFYDSVNDDTIVSVQYSDGLGRLIQSRAQCEEVIFGDQVFGDSGLPLLQTSSVAAVGTQNTSTDLNVIVSGWQVYNNKGKVVEKYEPFYDKGFDFSPPFQGGLGGMEGSSDTVSSDAFARGKKVTMFYDPRGQVIRTVNPDNTEQRVIFGIPLALDNLTLFTPTPWESYSYDANDLGELTHPSDTSVPSSHHYTPSNHIMDALGRTVKTVDRLAISSNDVVMQYAFDIRGNLLTVTDALGRTTFTHKYDLANRPLYTEHIDGGIKLAFMDCMSKPVELRDAKGALMLHSYDNLNRPVKVWARDKTGETVTLRQKIVYGDNAGLTSPENQNLKGKPYRMYDEAGLTKIDAYDFKGQVPEKIRQVISDSEILNVFSGPPASWAVQTYRVDWDTYTVSPDEKLDSFEYTTSMEYDALGRITQMTYPVDVVSERKILLPTYNRAGALVKVDLKDNPTATAVNYVENIAYNAKGQRLLVSFGNGMMTRYRYDDITFRLSRMKTEKYTKSGLTYTPNGGIQQNLAYSYDLSGNILDINDQTTGCGVANTDALDRSFSYDPLYRLLSATGRETATTASLPWDDTYRPADATLSRAYTQNYAYDKLGNIQSLQHVATSGNFTRNFNYITDKNKLDTIVIGGNTYNFIHDVNGNITSDDNNGSRFHEFDHSDQLRSFRIQTGTAEPTVYAHYLYDAGGNRVKKTVRRQSGGYSSTTYIDGIFEHTKASSYSDAIPNLQIGTWLIGGEDGEQNTLHIMNDKSGIATRRIGDALDDSTPAIKYNIDDHLGSSSILLDESGTLVSKEEYYPFGETSFGSYGKKRYRFCGKEKDEESGLYYYGMRYYSPWTCRFVSVDPLAGKYAHYSPYLYASNNPICREDIGGMGDPKAKGGGGNGTPVNENLNNKSNGTVSSEGKPNTQATDFNKDGVADFHKTKGGDTYKKLSDKYGVSIDNLRQWNGYKDTEIPTGVDLIVSKEGREKNSKDFLKSVGMNPDKQPEGNGTITQDNSIGNLMYKLIDVIKQTRPVEYNMTNTAYRTIQLPTATFREVKNFNGTSLTGTEKETAMAEIMLQAAPFVFRNPGITPPEPTYYRGGNSWEMSKPDMSAVDKTTGLMKERGVSINTNKLDPNVASRGAWTIDLKTLPEELKITFTKGTHFEITPVNEGTMTQVEYQNLVRNVKLLEFNFIR
jgi:RHS repeat-associated protein